MPFGLINPLAISQRLMDAVFAELKWRNLLVYLDDIIIFSHSCKLHISDLNEVFNRFCIAHLRLKALKCDLFQKELTYIGHLVSRERIGPDPDNLKAIISRQAPITKSDLKCIPDCTKTSYPLNLLTRGNFPFNWNAEHLAAFMTIKSHSAAH